MSLYTGTYTGLSDFDLTAVSDANGSDFVTNLSTNTTANTQILTNGGFNFSTTKMQVNALFAACTELAFNLPSVTAATKSSEYKAWVATIASNEAAMSLTDLDTANLSASNTAIKTAILGASKLASVKSKALQKGALKYFLTLTRPDGTNTTTENALESLLNCYIYQEPQEAAEAIFEAIAELSAALADPTGVSNAATLTNLADATNNFGYVLTKLKEAIKRAVSQTKTEPTWLNKLLATVPSASFNNLPQAKAVVALASLEAMYKGDIHEYVAGAKKALAAEASDPSALAAAAIEAKYTVSTGNSVLYNYYETATGPHQVRWSNIKAALVGYSTGINLALLTYINSASLYAINGTIMPNTTHPEMWSTKILESRMLRDWLDLMNSTNVASSPFLDVHLKDIATAAAPWSRLRNKVVLSTSNWKAYSKILDLYTKALVPSDGVTPMNDLGVPANGYNGALIGLDATADLGALVNSGSGMLNTFPKECIQVLKNLGSTGRVVLLTDGYDVAALSAIASAAYSAAAGSDATAKKTTYLSLVKDYGTNSTGTLTSVQIPNLLTVIDQALQECNSGILPKERINDMVTAATNMTYAEAVRLILPTAYTMANYENPLVKLWVDYLNAAARTTVEFATALNNVPGANWEEWLKHTFNYKSTTNLFNVAKGAHPFLAHCVKICCDATPATTYGATQAERATALLTYAINNYPREVIDYVTDIILVQTASTVASLAALTTKTAALIDRAVESWLTLEFAAVSSSQKATVAASLNKLLSESKYLARTVTPNKSVYANDWLAEAKNELGLAIKRATKNYVVIGIPAPYYTTLSAAAAAAITDATASTAIDSEVIVEKINERWFQDFITV
ncbi:MAG: hypothetical protein K0S74_1093 [Chlamydiales bacterium]|jgi:hypothetical protein|nr:hypothetical protein [Chlamydiales bacterium]